MSRTKIGRPRSKASARKSTFLTIRLSKGEKELIKKASTADKKRPCAWARSVLLELAKCDDS